MRCFTTPLAALMLAAAPAAALAHAYLKSSDPAAGASVPASTSRLLLTFTEEVQPQFCTVTVADAMGMQAQTAKPAPVPGHANELTVPLHFEMGGKYTVKWDALSTDGHKTHGSFSFTVSG